MLNRNLPLEASVCTLYSFVLFFCHSVCILGFSCLKSINKESTESIQPKLILCIEKRLENRTISVASQSIIWFFCKVFENVEKYRNFVSLPTWTWYRTNWLQIYILTINNINAPSMIKCEGNIKLVSSHL